jgi:hypothetical protein
VNSSAVRLLVVVALWLGALPAFAQDVPDPATADQGQGQDEQAPALDATPTPTADAVAVIAQWGPAPVIGSDADQAVAGRWFRKQNDERAKWGVPTATRDPYLDWAAENLMRSTLGQPLLPQPAGVVKPAVIATSPRSDQTVLGGAEPEFWTVSDDLWVAWREGSLAQPMAEAMALWEADHPGEPYYSPDGYLRLFKLRQTPRFDPYRVIGVAGRVNANNSTPIAVPSAAQGKLEQIAPGSVAAYQPVIYPDNLIAVVGYDPWLTSDGTLRP